MQDELVTISQNLIIIKNEASNLIIDVDSLDELNTIKLNFTGKNGKLTTALKDIAKLPDEKLPEVGRLANEIKNSVETLLRDKEKELSAINTEKKKQEVIDITLPGNRPPRGHLHLITQAIEEITDIFERIGFMRRRYPEIEWDWFSFEALNFPENHPARDDWETFFIDEKPDSKFGSMLLTPHTSSGQIRELLNAIKSSSEGQPLSVRMLNIAKTYRRQSDVSHTPMFHQFETLCVDKNISITHLKGVLDYFVKAWFGENRKSRIRPYHFQFTEPSFETDVSCGICNGTGNLLSGGKCKLCKEGWLELGGAGMVHPKVLKNSGIDPNVYTGFASGWGVERVLMMREGLELDDLRMIYSNNLSFLEQF